MSSLVTLENPQGDSDGNTADSTSVARAASSNRFLVLTDPEEMWTDHLYSIIGETAMMRFTNGKARMLGETQMLNLENVIEFLINEELNENEKLSNRCCEHTFLDICEDIEFKKNAFNDASDSLKYLVSLFVAFAGQQIISGKRSSFKESLTKEILTTIKSMVLLIGPEDLSCSMKWWMIIFYVYAIALRQNAEMYKINLILHGFLNLSLDININFCVPIGGCRTLRNGIPKNYQYLTVVHRPGAKSYASDDFNTYSIAHVVSYILEHYEEYEEGTFSLKQLLTTSWDGQKSRKKKAKQLRKEKAKLVWAKTRHERKEKNKVYHETELAKAELEEARRQKNLEAYHSQRVQRYYEKVWKEQEERKFFLNELKKPHVMSPSHKREEKIRRREQQEDSHSIWRAQKRKQRKAQK